MWNGKKKAVTFSFDDGVTQDIKAIEILDKYGLKATFNINSGRFGVNATASRNDVTTTHNKIPKDVFKEVYKNHEVAAHTVFHTRLTTLSDEEVVKAVNDDVKNLEELVGYDIHVMAYPCGGVNNDDRVAELIKNNTKIKLARTITSTYDFGKQDNYHRFNPSVYMAEKNIMDVVDRFLSLDSDEPQLLYLWGHTYEFDFDYPTWELFEEVCKKLSNKDDIFYGTNSEVLLNE